IQEEIFKGPLDHQLRSALRYIRNNFITEKIIKLPDQAEARRFFNYPYIAIEEALVNAVYHRSYEIREPIEVRINLDKIEILNFPGPDLSISADALKRERMVTRRYRNRRIGELLKELKFTEGRSTGMPKIHRALAANGSPPPRIETNEDRTYFLIEFPIHPEMLTAEVTEQQQVKAYVKAQDEAYDQAQVKLSETELKILHICQKRAVGNKEIIALLGHKSLGGHLKKSLKHLQEIGAIAYTIPEKPRSRNQQYKITAKGHSLLTSK
ncbi:MAG: AAA family ATPase, partial [Proteobacteria bacterium]|nr:AAA family ATPase [Pseudomonadota bacterium]